MALILLTMHSLPSAHAEPMKATLSVERAPLAASCDDRASLERRVDSILRRAATETAERGGGLGIHVRFGRDGNELVAEVTATGPKPGVRTLRDSGPSCDGLSAAVAVAIALLLDSAERAATEAPAPTGAASDAASTPPPTSNVSSKPSPSVIPQRDAPSPWHARASLAAAGGYGLGGAGTLLGLARLGARGEHWVFDVGAATSWPRTKSFDEGDVRTALAFGTARACYLLSRDVALGPCAQLGVGRLRGRGAGYGETREVSLLWTAASLGLGAELPLGKRLSASLEASFWLPFERLTFSVQNRGIAWESAPVAGFVGAGLSLRLF